MDCHRVRKRQREWNKEEKTDRKKAGEWGGEEEEGGRE
jgi:hypothetical protein